MLNAKQIAAIINDELRLHIGRGENAQGCVNEAAEKIASMIGDNGAAVAAASLENEVTSTLMDMTVATVLATLIEEEGGGRSNVSISPMSMDHMQQHYLYEVRNEGLVRHVSITLRDDSPLHNEEEWRKPSNRHGLVQVDNESGQGAQPQAEEHVFDRPVWAVRFWCPDGTGSFRPELKECADREQAENVVRGYRDDDGRPNAVVENRHCLHPECPTTGCNQSEVTSQLTSD